MSLTVTPTPPPQPDEFRRPLITDGHASANATHGLTPGTPPSSRPVNPDQFTRPLITAGHEAAAPGAMPGNARVDSVRTGPARELYGTASSAAGATATQGLHDRLAPALSSIGPMATSRPVMPAAMQDTAVPRPTAMPTARMAPGETTGGAR